MKFVIIDLETTGLSPYKHKITEIAAVRFDWEKILDSYQSLVNPERHIPSGITRLTGITNEMVENAPTIDEVLPEFIDFLADDIFVAHNISFDWNFLNYARNHMENKLFCNPKLCTRKLARHLVPELNRRTLAILCEYFQIKNDNAHRALSDVYATTELLKNYIQIIKKNWMIIDEFIEFDVNSKK